MRTRITTVLASASLLATLTACSSSSDDADKATAPASSTARAEQPTTPAPAADDGLEKAVFTYTAAYFEGDADTAYAALTKRCKGKISPEAYAAVVKQAHADYGEQHVTSFTADQVQGDLARVSYKVGLPKFDQTGQPWAREGGAWKYDAC